MNAEIAEILVVLILTVAAVILVWRAAVKSRGPAVGQGQPGQAVPETLSAEQNSGQAVGQHSKTRR